MMYHCKGHLTCPACESEIDCGHEFEVCYSGGRPATRDDPEESAECDPCECPECGTEVDVDGVEEAIRDSVDYETDDCDDPRDSRGDSLVPEVRLIEGRGVEIRDSLH